MSIGFIPLEHDDIQPEWVVRCPSCREIANPDTRKIKHKATTPVPDIETLMEWDNDGGSEATDGCWVEPDGICEHGHLSWLRRMGYI